MPLTRPPAPPVPPPARTAPPVAPMRAPAPPPQRAAAPVPPPAQRPAAPPPMQAAAAQRATASQGVVQTTAHSAGPSDSAIRSAQLKFYEAGTAYFVRHMEAPPLTTARPSVSAPSVATAQTAATPAANGVEKRPVGRPPGRPPASTVSKPVLVPAPVATAPSAPVVAGEVPSTYTLAGMTRKDLVELAKSMGLETQGVKGDDLRVMIANAGGAPTAATDAAPTEVASLNEQYMNARATINMNIIDSNLDKYEDLINPESTNPDALKCGGDCLRCPNPGNFPHAADQVANCYNELHNDLGLAQEYPVEATA